MNLSSFYLTSYDDEITQTYCHILFLLNEIKANFFSIFPASFKPGLWTLLHWPSKQWSQKPTGNCTRLAVIKAIFVPKAKSVATAAAAAEAARGEESRGSRSC